MSKLQKGTQLANIFGTFGYLSIFMQWFWFIAVVILPYLQDASFTKVFLPAKEVSHAAPLSTLSMPPLVQGIIAIIAIVFTLAVTVYAIYMVPRSIGKVGKSFTQKSAQVTVSHVKHHHKPLTVRERKRIYEYVTWSIKSLLILLPCLLLFLPTRDTLTISHEIVLAIGVFCASLSVFWFVLQYVVSRIAHSDTKDIW